MKRLIEQRLEAWKNNANRKPLLLNGIRQVGKTWILKDFGRRYFKDLLYVNFELEPSICSIFNRSKNPGKILMELSILFGKSINPEETMIFFDEIQGCNDALNSLKYFHESEENYFVVAAGSYLGIALSKGDSFPVGKVDMIDLKPMTFKEFLLAQGEDQLVGYMESISVVKPISEPLLEKLQRHFRDYYIVGGMPEAVNEWINTKSVESVERVQSNILNAYFRDFSKYPQRQMIPRIIGIWESIEVQLSRENKKFKYSEIGKSARAREYEGALAWLMAGNYLKKVARVNAIDVPIKGFAQDNHFKIYMPDVGLLRKKAEYPAEAFSDVNKETGASFKGAISENAVLQELDFFHDKGIFYWSSPNMEIDFVIQKGLHLYPIEVKYGENVKSRSLSKFLMKYPECTGIRYSMKNLTHDGRMINIPLPLVSETGRFLELLKI